MLELPKPPSAEQQLANTEAILKAAFQKCAELQHQTIVGSAQLAAAQQRIAELEALLAAFQATAPLAEQ